MNLVLALLCCNTCCLLNNESSKNLSPRVVIVGAGAAGIAAASRLLENGFTDVTIIEAESRTGGRIYSKKFGNYMVDLGAQWVHGEKNNVVFELAWPLGILERMKGNFDVATKYFGSSGLELSYDVSNKLREFGASIGSTLTDVEHLESGSFGEYAELRFTEFFQAHPEIREDLYEPIVRTMDLAEMTLQGADSWYDVSLRGIQQAAECEGDQSINWKNRTYAMILDILMKKYPDPKLELPVLKKIHKMSRVTRINYNEKNEGVRVSTADGKEYTAGHVIFTPSLGVLKANHHQLFEPPLPRMKVNAIEPEKRWMLGIYGIAPVEHRPKLLCLWMSSNYSIEMESVPEEIFRNQTLSILNLFYGGAHNITEPTRIRRTKWNTNIHFRGTYSYSSISADLANVSFVDLAEPIYQNGKPILQFAGEATSKHYSTVHGAIESGWREADRLIDLYKSNQSQSLLTEVLPTSIE